jgi:Skp family chaperone for outer membrane proteins
MTRRFLIAVSLIAAASLLVALSRASVRTAPSGPIATVDTLRLMERMLQLPEFADPRTAEIERMQGELTPFDTQLRGLVGQLEELDQQDPLFAAIQAQAQQVQNQLIRGQQQAQYEIDEFAARQFASAFARVREASRIVTEQEGYQYALTSREDDSVMQTSSTALFVQEILYRHALVSPKGTDITELVAAHLQLPEQTDEQAAEPLVDPNALNPDAQPAQPE